MLLLLLLSAAPAPPDLVEDHEPSLGLYFQLDGGQRVNVELDKPFNPAELGRSAVLKLDADRHFAYAGLELSYPREYGFEAKLEPLFAQWTLSGNDTKLIIQRYKNKKPEVLHKSVVAEVQKAFGGKAKESPVTLNAGGKPLTGTRLEIDVSGTAMVQELYPIKSGTDVVELIIQDKPKGGQSSPERARTQRLLEETLKLPK